MLQKLNHQKIDSQSLAVSNGLEVRRIFSVQKLKKRFGSLKTGSFHGGATEMFGQLRKKKWMHAVYGKKDEEGSELDLLVSREGFISCGGL